MGTDNGRRYFWGMVAGIALFTLLGVVIGAGMTFAGWARGMMGSLALGAGTRTWVAAR